MPAAENIDSAEALDCGGFEITGEYKRQIKSGVLGS